MEQIILQPGLCHYNFLFYPVSGSESIARKVAEFVVRAFQNVNAPNPVRHRPVNDAYTDYTSNEEAFDKRPNNDVNEGYIPMSPLRRLVKLFGLQPNQISAVAVNALVFVAQMVSLRYFLFIFLETHSKRLCLRSHKSHSKRPCLMFKDFCLQRRSMVWRMKRRPEASQKLPNGVRHVDLFSYLGISDTSSDYLRLRNYECAPFVSLPKPIPRLENFIYNFILVLLCRASMNIL